MSSADEEEANSEEEAGLLSGVYNSSWVFFWVVSTL